MRRAWATRIGVTVLLITCACVMLYCWSLTNQLDASGAKLRKFESYCAFTRMSLQFDAWDLRNSAKRAKAALRFHESNEAGHRSDDIAMCSSVKIDTEVHTACLLANDFDCLAKLADQAAEGIR